MPVFQFQRILNLPSSTQFLDYNIISFYGLFLFLSKATETMNKTHKVMKPGHVYSQSFSSGKKILVFILF